MFGSQMFLRGILRRIGQGRPVRLRPATKRHRLSLRRPALGVEIRGSSLYLACVRPGWRRRWLVATEVIDDFSQLNPEQLGLRLREFLRSARGEEPVVVVGLPRREAIVRLLELPGAAKKSLRDALHLQMELYKPTDEEGFCWDAAVVSHEDQLGASLALLPRTKVDSLASQFSAAGYPIARLTIGQFSLLRMIRQSRRAASASRLLCLDFRGAEAELAGVCQQRLVYSRALPLPGVELGPEQVLLSEVQQALATLRWKGQEPIDFLLVGAVPRHLEPALAELGKVYHLREWCQCEEEAASSVPEDSWGATALALDGLSWSGDYRLNLLPVELRPQRRRWRHAPTYALLATNTVLLAALGLRAPVQQQLLLRKYSQEMVRVEKVATDVEHQLQNQKRLRKRLELLSDFQQRGRLPLEALSEIAQKLPAEAWLTLFNYQQGRVEVMGAAKSASALLPVLQGSPQFEEVKFEGALTREATGTERFRMQMQMKAGQ